MPTATSKVSLARVSGCFCSGIVSFLIVCAHGFFAFAQLSGSDQDCPGYNSTTGCPNTFAIGGLGQVLIYANADYEAKGLLSNALGLLEDGACGTSCPHGNQTLLGPGTGVCDLLACDACVAVAGVESSQHCDANVEKTLLHMSYLYSVKHLWGQDEAVTCQTGHEPTCTGIYPGRPAAACLVIFSFIWPHVKLLLLHLFFYLPLSTTFRRNGNYWLSFFGKWTLTDVLVMCVVVGLLNLTASMDLLTIWQDFKPEFSTLCVEMCDGLQHADAAPGAAPPADPFAAALLGGFEASGAPWAERTLWAGVDGGGGGSGGGGERNCTSLCAGVASALDKTVLSPQDLPSSSIDLHLRMRGLVCMYFFCIAVVISLSTSVLVEYLDDRARAAAAPPLQQPMLLSDGAHHGGGGGGGGFDADAPAQLQGLQSGGGDEAKLLGLVDEGLGGGGKACLCVAPRNARMGPLVAARPREGVVHLLLVVAQLGATLAAYCTPLFSRVMRGSLCAFLLDRGFDFNGEYTLLQLGMLAGQAGGWDYLMATTFWIFIVVCPLLRSLSLLALLLLPLRHDAAVRLHLASRYVSYYWALEIMLMAVPLTSIAMGPMTANLLSDLNFPPCIELNKHYPNPPGEPKDLCFAVDVQPDLGYNLTCVTVVLYLLAGFDGSPAHKYIHRLLYPDDAAPPPNWWWGK